MAPAAVANVLAPIGSLFPRIASLALGAHFARDWRRRWDVLRWGRF
jgi:hypothetical protein